MLAPAWVVCGSPAINSVQIFFPEHWQTAVLRAAKADEYSYNIYPHEFYNREGLDMHGCTGQLWQFPLFDDWLFGDKYPQDRGLQNFRGVDRLVIDECGHLCAIVTHRGAPGNDFNP